MNRTSLTGFAAVTLFMGGAVAWSVQPVTEQQCRETLRQRLNQCGNFGDTVARRECMATAVSAYRTCLNQVPPPAPGAPDEMACWVAYGVDLAQCISRYPCNGRTDPARNKAPCQRRDACIRAASQRYQWCESRLVAQQVPKLTVIKVLPMFVDPGVSKVKVGFEIEGDEAQVHDVIVGVMTCDEVDADWRNMRTLAKLVGIQNHEIEVDVVIDTQFTTCNDAAILFVVVLKPDGSVATAEAAEVGVYWDERDLNRDGVVDLVDYNIALQRLADGSIDAELFTAIAEAIAGS